MPKLPGPILSWSRFDVGATETVLVGQAECLMNPMVVETRPNAADDSQKENDGLDRSWRHGFRIHKAIPRNFPPPLRCFWFFKPIIVQTLLIGEGGSHLASCPGKWDLLKLNRFVFSSAGVVQPGNRSTSGFPSPPIGRQSYPYMRLYQPVLAH